MPTDNPGAILNWRVEGCQILVEEGMKLTVAVMAATNAYRADSDKV